MGQRLHGIRLYFFFDKNRQYLYNLATRACTESPLLLTLTPFAAWLSKAASADGGNAQTMEAAFLNNSLETPLFLSGRTPHGITTLNVDSFTAGQPGASVFSLSAACTE